MPRTRSLAWAELRIGALTIVALVIAAVLIFSLTGTKGFFWERYMLKTRLTNVVGLAPGSPVRVAGVQVGSIKAVQFAGEQVDVIFDMRKDLRDRITTGSIDDRDCFSRRPAVFVPVLRPFSCPPSACPFVVRSWKPSHGLRVAASV